MITPKFNSPHISIYAELKKRVNEYFNLNNLKPTGNAGLYFKAALLIVSYVLIYVHLVFYTPQAWLALTECIFLGLLTAAIGFNIMHDGAHGSFSDYPKLNKAAAYSLDLLGASSFMWNTKHNIVHHAYTNIGGVDDDIEAGMLLRMAPHQKRRSFHKYQHLYFWLLYGFLYIAWVFYTDYKKYFTNKVGNVPLKKFKPFDHVAFWIFKGLHLYLFVILPILMVGPLPWCIGFLVFSTSSGIILSLVFQLAHVIEETAFPTANQSTNKMEDEWALHQLKTTANFATTNKLITWWVGGLNYQVEHHLFPKISHIHYPAISSIIKQTCADLSAPYIEHDTMYGAVMSHIKHLKQTGTQD